MHQANQGGCNSRNFQQIAQRFLGHIGIKRRRILSNFLFWSNIGLKMVLSVCNSLLQLCIVRLVQDLSMIYWEGQNPSLMLFLKLTHAPRGNRLFKPRGLALSVNEITSKIFQQLIILRNKLEQWLIKKRENACSNKTSSHKPC